MEDLCFHWLLNFLWATWRIEGTLSNFRKEKKKHCWKDVTNSMVMLYQLSSMLVKKVFVSRILILDIVLSFLLCQVVACMHICFARWTGWPVSKLKDKISWLLVCVLKSWNFELFDWKIISNLVRPWHKCNIYIYIHICCYPWVNVFAEFLNLY